jgi:regulator of cell morphogenesis and NO signaling
MVTIDLETPIGQLVRERPARSRVFDSLQIDYCCGGKRSLRDACRRRDVSPTEALERILESDLISEAGDLVDAESMTLTELADHIEQRHHTYLKNELPRLDRMTEKVSRVHGKKEPRLIEVRQAFLSLRAELEPHMIKEERVLFPMVRELEASFRLSQLSRCSVAGPIGQMEHEHASAGDALATIRRATDGFVPPEWACNTYRAMLDGLEHLERDMHQHIHKENNVLFPKALQLESRCREQ